MTCSCSLASDQTRSCSYGEAAAHTCHGEGWKEALLAAGKRRIVKESSRSYVGKVGRSDAEKEKGVDGYEGDGYEGDGFGATSVSNVFSSLLRRGRDVT